ncbi:MAG TPA: hypothetical protein VN081_00670 [Dongiaceae bacterium]|nr:hypothetical protein [Dongiaceae bacterium]
MHHRLQRFRWFTFARWRYLLSEEFLAILLAAFVFVMPAAASTRLQDRSLLMQSNEPGVTTSYTVSYQYMTPLSVGSVDMLFCESPIPYDPCIVPQGLDVSHASLSSQTGEIGFSILSQTTNHIILSRTPAMVSTGTASSYKFDNIVNPTDQTQAFSIRLKTLGSTDGSGAQIDFGSVRGQVQSGIVLQTQVPPMLIFCAAREVDLGCLGTDDTYYTNMGQLSPTDTLVAQSQMAVGTNASGGFAITVNGTPLAAATTIIAGAATPADSQQGIDQFGINLVANNEPAIGKDPEGTWTNAAPTADYSQPNKYKYVSGDVVASSPNVSLMKKFTVSYIANASPALRAGVYTTTITYIASGRF